jgi:hypothetical protein
MKVHTRKSTTIILLLYNYVIIDNLGGKVCLDSKGPKWDASSGSGATISQKIDHYSKCSERVVALFASTFKSV